MDRDRDRDKGRDMRDNRNRGKGRGERDFDKRHRGGRNASREGGRKGWQQQQQHRDRSRDPDARRDSYGGKGQDNMRDKGAPSRRASLAGTPEIRDSTCVASTSSEGTDATKLSQQSAGMMDRGRNDKHDEGEGEQDRSIGPGISDIDGEEHRGTPYEEEGGGDVLEGRMDLDEDMDCGDDDEDAYLEEPPPCEELGQTGEEGEHEVDYDDGHDTPGGHLGEGNDRDDAMAGSENGHEEQHPPSPPEAPSARPLPPGDPSERPHHGHGQPGDRDRKWQGPKRDNRRGTGGYKSRNRSRDRGGRGSHVDNRRDRDRDKGRDYSGPGRDSYRGRPHGDRGAPKPPPR